MNSKNTFVNVRWLAIFYSVLMVLSMASCSARTAEGETAFLVQLTGERRYQGQEPVVVEVRFTNNTDIPLRLLKWGTPLESSMTRDSYQVMRNGESLPYIGRLVKRGPPQDGDFQMMEPGRTVTGTVDLSQGYALDQTGEYSVRLRPQVLQFRDVRDVKTVSEAFHFLLE